MKSEFYTIEYVLIKVEFKTKTNEMIKKWRF